MPQPVFDFGNVVKLTHSTIDAAADDLYVVRDISSVRNGDGTIRIIYQLRRLYRRGRVWNISGWYAGDVLERATTREIAQAG